MANNLARRLRREVTASPKKAAALGLLLVVALWFWAPLLGKWFGSKPGVEPAVATTANLAGVESTQSAAVGIGGNAATATANEGRAKSPTWKQVIEWMASDPKMRPYFPSGEERDPFAGTASKIVVREETPADVAPTPPPELTPQQAGLNLASTVVGAGRRTALINGRAYREQQTVTASNGRDRFVVLEIRRTSVVLDRNGQRYELKLPAVEVDAADDLTSTTDRPAATTDY